MSQEMTYQEWEAQQAQWMEGQDDLWWNGYKVTPAFDMVIDGQRIRPQTQHRPCFPARVKRHGTTAGSCPTVWMPKMHISPVC